MLAGFNDGRAGEGVGAGAPSLRGTLIAAEKGWSAPDSEQRTGVGTSSAATASAAADVQDREAKTSGSDTPAVDPGTKNRAGTEAGKPPGEATKGEADPGTGTEKKG